MKPESGEEEDGGGYVGLATVVPKALRVRVKQWAISQGMTVQDFIRAALVEKLTKERGR